MEYRLESIQNFFNKIIMIKKYYKKLAFIVFGLSTIFSQINFEVNWTPYVTYYLSMVDINTGESNMPIFLAELSRENDDETQVQVDIEFEIIIDSDALGVNSETLVKIETTSPIELTAPIFLSNMDLNLSTDALFDSEGNSIDLNLEISEQMDLANAEQMMSSIIQTGQLPEGIYTFKVTARVPNGGEEIIREDIINISNPDFLQLVSPGGVLSDTTINEIYTSYPVFQWESDLCNYVDPITSESGCEYYIRVAEFNSNEHSSIDQAIESLTRLPLDQSLGFEKVGYGFTTFQYPSTEAGDLEPGKVYVWQVRKDLITTSGTEQILSDIMVFKVKDFSSIDMVENGSEDSSPVGILLRSILGDDTVNTIFGSGGEAEGMATNGKITLNGENVDVSIVQSLVSMGIEEEGEDGDMRYRAIEVLEIEVSD